jgi:hypothetical protein
MSEDQILNEFTLLENRLRQPFLDSVKKYGKQKFTLWAIWTYMLWRSTNGVFCLPEELVLTDWDMNPKTLRRVHDILIKEGWLQRDVLRNTGGMWMTRTWVITSPPQPHNGSVDNADKSFVSPATHLSTVDKWGHSGSIGLGFGLDSFDLGSRSAASPPVQSESKDERQPITSEPTATTRATPTPTAARGHGQEEGKRQKKTCSKCGAILKRDENHLLTCRGAEVDEFDEFDAENALDDPDAL